MGKKNPKIVYNFDGEILFFDVDPATKISNRRFLPSHLGYTFRQQN
jgi:hypothetical protein